MIGAAALAEKAAAGLGMSTARVEGPAQFQAAPKVAFGRLIEYEPGRAAKAPNYSDLVRPLTMRGAGESFDLEREETLGDSFLKYWTSLKLYLCEKESLDEGALTTKRSRLIGNKNLFECGRRLGLPDVVTHEKFEPQRNWRPPLFRCNGDVEKLLVELDTDYRDKHPRSGHTLFHALKADDVEELLETADAEDRKRLVERIMARKLDGPDSAELGRHMPREHRLISDKSVADAVEALIGCYLGGCGQAAAAEFIRWAGVYGAAGDGGASHWRARPESAVLPHVDRVGLQERARRIGEKIDVAAVERILGHEFREKSFLWEALTHCSYSPHQKLTNSYERLEFLGDAVIDFLVTCHLFSEHPNLNPGELTNLRSALVNNNTLARISVESRLYTHLLYNSPRMLSKINEYVAYTGVDWGDDANNNEESNPKDDKMIENLDLINEEDCPELEDIEVPKVLGDTVEAVMGAVFVDSGFDLRIVWKCFRHIFPKMEDIVSKNPKNVTARLYERFPSDPDHERVKFRPLEKTKKGKAQVLVEVEVGLASGRAKQFFFRGIGNTKKRAKEASARCAIRELIKRNLFLM